MRKRRFSSWTEAETEAARLGSHALVLTRCLQAVFEERVKWLQNINWNGAVGIVGPNQPDGGYVIIRKQSKPTWSAVHYLNDWASDMEKEIRNTDPETMTMVRLAREAKRHQLEAQMQGIQV